MNSKCSQVIYTDIYFQANIFLVALTCLIKAVLTSLFSPHLLTRKLFEIQTSATVAILGSAGSEYVHAWERGQRSPSRKLAESRLGQVLRASRVKASLFRAK